MSGVGDSMETKMDINEETESKNLQGGPQESGDFDAQLNIENKPEGGIIESSTHPLLGSVVEMIVPPSEYSGIPQLTAEADPELMDVKKKKKKNRKKSTEKREMHDRDEEKSPPVLSKYDEVVLSTAASINKDRITQPLLPLFEEEPNLLERDSNSPHSRRGRTGRNFDSGRGERYDDDYYSSRKNDGVGWNRPRHGKYKYPDDFDEEDFEEDFDSHIDEEYRPDDDNRSHRGNYAPRSFGQGPRGGLLATPTGYGSRNYGPANFGPRQFASGLMGQGPEHMGPRGPVGSSGPGSGSMGPVSGPMGPRAGQMSSGHGQMGSGPNQMGSGPGQMGPGPGQMRPGPGQMGPGQMGPGPMGPGPGQMGPMGPGPGQMGPMGPGPGQMGPMGSGPGQMGPMGPGPMGPGPMGPGPGQMGPMGPGPMGPGPGQMGPMGPGPGQMGPGPMGPGPGQMGPGPGQMGPGPMGPGPGMGPPGGPICGPGPMSSTGPYPPRGPGFGPPIPGGYSDGYHGPPPVQGFSSVPTLNPFPPSQSFMPPHSQAPTFSGEVFQSGIFNPSAMPSFLGMPPQLPPMPLADTSKPPPLTESAEKLIAQGMNPDLAKILDVNSKKPYRSDSSAGIQKQKKKKKKNKSYDQIDSDNAVNLNLDEVPLPPMSIPLPDEVPLPPEPKKKKKKSKRDKDLENVMFPPMPEEVPTVEGPPLKPVSPPFVAHVSLDPINNSNQLPSSNELVPEMVSAPQLFDQVQQHDFAQSEDIKNDIQSLHWQTVSSEQSSLTTVLPAVHLPGQQIFEQQMLPLHQDEVGQVSIQSTLSQSMSSLNQIQAVPSQITNVSASNQQPELSTSSLLTPQASVSLAQSPSEVVDSNAPFQHLQSNTQLSNVLPVPTSKILGASQVLQPVMPVRRSRFDLTWIPDSSNAALPSASVQQVTVQLPTTTTLQLPALPSVPLLVTTNNVDVNTSLSMGHVSISEQGRTLIVPQENLISETKEQYQIPQAETVEQTHEHISYQHVLGLPNQQTSSNNDSSVSLKSESCVEDKTVSYIVDEKDTSSQMDVEESENLTLKVKDETEHHSENKMDNKEDAQTEQLVTKEPITASMLLEKFKQKQLQKSDTKNEFSKCPVVVPSLISQKAIADESKVQSDSKSQGKFTFAIRKLKQLEAEQEEEEKQVLTAVNSESEVAQITQDNTTKHVEEGTKKEKGLKEQKQSSAERVSKVQPRKKSRSVSRSKKSKSRSSSKEKIRNRRQKSKSKDRSKSRDRGTKLHERSREKQSRSGERRKMSRERSRSKERFSLERKSRRSRSKERKRSLSPWRKDREFFKRYGRMPWPGEADSITAESINTRSGGRLQRSLDGGRFRHSSRDRDVFEGKGRDRERWDIQSRNRQSTDRSRDRGRREKIEEKKSRSKERSKERGRYVSIEKSRKARKVMADSSSDTESTSESDSSEQYSKKVQVKQKKRISSKERERSYSPDKINTKKKKESRYTPVKSKDLIKEQAENVQLMAKGEAMDTGEKILNDDVHKKKSKYVKNKYDASSIPEDNKEQSIGNVVIKQEPVDAHEYVEKPQIVSELLQPKPISRNINSDSDTEMSALESKKDGKLKSLEDGGEEIDTRRRADKENRIEDVDILMEDKVRQRKDLILRSVQSRDSQEYEEKENVKERKIIATDGDISDKQIFQVSRSKSKDEKSQRRSKNVERTDEDDSVQHVAKSKWDSESDSNDDDFAHHHIEELSLGNSQRLQKEPRIPSTSKSDLEKLEIDISKINQMKLLSKMMKGKGEKSCSDNESGSSDEEDLQVKKKHRKEKQSSKKLKKEKKKKHDESDSEDEDSPVKHKKKKKSKKKKKVKNDENTDDEFEKSKKKKKDRHMLSDTDKSEDEYKGKEKVKKMSKKSKQDIDSEDSASLKSKSKSRPIKGERRNSDSEEVEWIPHGKLQSKSKKRKDSGQDSENEMSRHKEKSKVYNSEDEYFDKKKKNDKKDKHYRDNSTERNDSYKKDDTSKLKNVKHLGRDQSEELDFAPKHGSRLKHVRKLSPESDVESVRIKKDKRTVDKNWKQHSDSDESYKKQKGKSLIKEPSDSEMSDTTHLKEWNVRKGSKESENSYKSEKEIGKRKKSKENEISYKNEEKDKGFNHKTYEKVRGDSKGKHEKSKSSDYEEYSNKSDQKGRGDSKSKLGDSYKNDNYDVKENILTEELLDKDKMKKAERKDSDKDVLLQDSRLSKVKQIVKERGELKERKEESREISSDLEKSRKRGRSCNLRSNSRSSSRTKILKTENYSRKMSSSSSPDVKTKGKTYMKESSDDDKQSADKYAKKTEIARKVKSRKKESSSPEFHSKKKDERYSPDRRKDESLQDLKYGKKSSSRWEISDDDYRSRKKRDVDKEKYSHDRKSATSNSSDQSSSQSSSSDSGSESVESKHYKTKTTGSKNVQAGTSSKMELVPGSLKINNTKLLLEQNSSIFSGENIVKAQKSLDMSSDNTCSKAKDNFQNVPFEIDCEDSTANKKLAKTNESKEVNKCLDISEGDIDKKVNVCDESILKNVMHSKQETFHTENKKLDKYIGKENMLVDYEGSSSDSDLESIEIKKEQPDQTAELLQQENVNGSASFKIPYTENQNVGITMVDTKEICEKDCKNDLDENKTYNLSDLYDPFEMMEMDDLDTVANNSTTGTPSVLSDSNCLTKLPVPSISSIPSEQSTVSVEPLKVSLVPPISTVLAPITPVPVPAPLGLPDASCISKTTSQRNYEVTGSQLSFPSQTITTTGTQNANDFSLPIVEQSSSVGQVTADKVKSVCPTLTVSAPGSSYSVSTKQSDSTFSKKEVARSTSKSRWDNNNVDTLTKEHVAKEELYDPFTIEGDEFLPQSPSNRKNNSSASVVKETSCISEHETLQQGYTASKEAIHSSSQVMKSNVCKDTQNKVTMKFTLGRKIIGKSAIVVDEGDDSNETVEIPKLKLSTPTEITGNDSLTLSEIMKLCLEEPKKECFEKKSKYDSIGEVAARTDDIMYASGKSRVDTSPGLKKCISERSELSIFRERKNSRERRRDRSISKERRMKSSNTRDRHARSCSRDRDKRYDSRNKRQRSTSGDHSHKDNLKDKHKERSHSREKKSKKRNSTRARSKEDISPKVMIERQRSCSPRKRSHSPRGRNRKESSDRNAGKSSDDSSESSSEDEYTSSLGKERLKGLHVFKESVFKHGRESSLKSENLDMEMELEKTLQKGTSFNTDEKVRNSLKKEKVGNAAASDFAERDTNMDMLVSSHRKLSEDCNIQDIEALDSSSIRTNASIGKHKKCLEMDEEICIVENKNIVDATKNKKGIFFKEHSPEKTYNDTSVLDQRFHIKTHFHQQNSVTQGERENEIITEQMATDTSDFLMHPPEHLLVKRLTAVRDLHDDSVEKVSQNSLLVEKNEQRAVINLLIHKDEVMETSDSECELDQTGDEKRSGQEEKQMDHINVPKRLTKRAASEQKVLLPPAMSKDMPTSGKKADRIAIDKSSPELTSSLMWTSENLSSHDFFIEVDALEEQNSKISKSGSHPLSLDVKQPCTQSDKISNLTPQTEDGQLSLGQNVCYSQCEIGEIALHSGKGAKQVTDGAAINVSEVESEMNTISGLSDPRVQEVRSKMLNDNNQQEIGSSASAAVKKDTKGLSIKLATKTLVKSCMLPQFDDVFEISSSRHEKLKQAKPVEHKPIHIKSVKSLPCEISKSIDTNQDNKAVNFNYTMPKSIDSQLVTQSEGSNLNKEARTDGSSDALNVSKDSHLADSSSSFVKKTEDFIKQTVLAPSENNSPNDTNAGIPSIQLHKHDKSVKLLSHISPEQIGKAIQVIGQENLRRIEVLQRKSSQLTVGNKIEVLGKTNGPDSSRIIAAESLEKSRIINELASKLQVLTANVVQSQSRPSNDQNPALDLNPPQIPKDSNLYCLQNDTNETDISHCLPNQQNLILQPNIQNTDHRVSTDNESNVLENKKEQLLCILHTESVPEQRFEAVVTRKFSDDMPRNSSGSGKEYEKYPASTNVSKEENSFEIRRDRYDDDRYNKGDYDKRRQNIRDRRQSSRERSHERGSRERSLERAGRRRNSDRNRSHDREKSREKDRSRSRERRNTRRYRDDERYRDNKLSRRYSRSRSWSKDKRSRSRDRRSRSRGRRSRSHDRGRNRSRDRRSKSRDRRSSRSRDRHRKRKSRSRDRVRKSRSRSGSRDIDKKSDREKNENSCKESALEQFEKVLAEKKKIFLQPTTSTSQSSMQQLSHDQHIQHFADVQGQYPVHDTAVHFLPQPFPVHQQSIPQPFPLPHPMSEQTYPAFPMDPNMMFHQHIGSQFYHEAVTSQLPPQLSMTVPFQGLPGHFQPEMFSPVNVPQPVEPNFLPPGPPGHAHPLMSNFNQFGPDISHMGHDNSHFGAEICFVPDGQEHRPVEETRHYRRGRNYHQQYSEEDATPYLGVDVNMPEVKHGIGGRTGAPGLHEVKIKLRTSLDQQPNNERRQTKQIDTAESRAALEQLPYIERPAKQSDMVEEREAYNIQKIEPETLTSQRTENHSNENASKLRVDKTTGFGQWTPVSPKKENEFPIEQGKVAESGSDDIAEGDKFLKKSKSALVSEIGADSTPPTEDLAESGTVGIPLKLRSCWHPASEIETPPPPPPPVRLKERKGPRTVMKDGKAVVIGPDEKIDEDTIPIDFELIEENVHLAERKRSKQMREVRRMVCDCTTSKEDRDMGYIACGEDCLNRMLFIECGSKCPCGEHCTNKRFQRKLNAKVIPFKTKWKGHGLKAVEDLEPGGFIMEYVGEVLDYPLFKKRSKQYSKAGQQHFYFMAISPEEIVDATAKGNVSRFINHSCDPNCETQKWTVNGSLRVGFFVKKPIKKDEEITFDYKYEVYGQEAQKCFCGTDICRGLLGGNKRIELRSSRRSTSVDELERKKKELFDDSDKLEEEIERMSELEEGLRNKNDVLNICRLMVRAEDPLHRMQILKVLENTTELACLRLFLDYHGLPLVWCWMADVKDALSDLKPLVMKILRKLPVTNKTILKDSKILDIVKKWSIPAPEGVMETTEITEQLPENSENTEDDSETLLSPPVSLNKNPVSILASLRDKKSVKKSVKFADEASSSDSESRASASESDVTETVEGDVTSSSNIKDVETKRYALRRRVLKKDGPVIRLADLENEDVTQSTDADSSSENQSSSSQPKELGTTGETTEVSQQEESKSLDSVSRDINEEITESKNCVQGDKSESGISDRETEELECIVKAAEIKNMAAGLLEHWSGLKEIYKIPKKQVLEERKKTERELDTNYEKISKIEERKKKESGWETDKSRKRKWDVREDTDDSDSGLARKSLLATLPRLSKSERRQRFEAKVKERDELAAEYQRQQEMMQQEQFEQEQMVQQQHQRQLMQDPSFWFYATQDPSFLPSIGIDPQQFLQQLAMDPVLLQQLMATVPNFPQQLEHLTLMYQQAVLQASQQEMQQLFLDGVQPLQEPTDELMTEQHMAFLQQVEVFKQQHIESKLEVTSVFDDDDVPPPPSPPKGKAVVLPPNWKTAKDAEGKMYYYHTVTRQTQWDPPNLDTGEHADDMDLGTPTLDDITKEDRKEEREKTTTAAADTSSETSRKLKEQFKSKMSSWIVVCLNPFRKQDCKSGKIINTEDFKHLARKLTHHVMAKELKHCRHVEDLEVNENVKSKAKDFVKKYMAKFGSSYKRSGNSPTYD